jgi:hypothetical protein
MAVYFVFSDEAGDYSKYPSQRFLNGHPYLIRAGVLIKGDNWPLLRDAFSSLKGRYPFPKGCELKWSYIGSIMAHRKRGENIPNDREYSPFRDFSNEELLGFVRDTISLLRQYEFCRIVYTITDNSREWHIAKDKLYKMHIQDLMQRTEIQLQDVVEGLAVMLLDPKDEATDSSVRNAYAAIYRDGDFITKYNHITDSLSFALSNQSFGIRFADYSAGIFNNFMREYSVSTGLFKDQVWPLIYKNPIGNPLGWGICEVPTDSSARGKIRERLVAAGLLSPISEQEAML